MGWLYGTMGAGRSALAVGILIWFRAGIEKRRMVRICPNQFPRISRHRIYAGLKLLEAAALISVGRRPGRCTVVTVQSLD